MPIVKSFHRTTSAFLIALAGLAALTAPTLVAAGGAEPNGSSAYVLFGPGSRGADMSGSMEDIQRASSLRAGTEPLLYVREGGSAYVIRDAATVRKAKSFFEPEEALGARQSELGSRQSALGRQQSRLGAEQAALSNRQANSSPREAEGLARQEEALSHRQEELGRQQEALGREQERVARIATEQIKSLISEALRSGLAQRVE